MCTGGGGGGTVYEPDYKRANSDLSTRLEAMKAQQSSSLLLVQQGLNSELARQQSILDQLRSVKEARANETAANARRMAELIGAPPPEKSAVAPTVASNRGRRTTGRTDLKIGTGRPSSPGAGINLTS